MSDKPKPVDDLKEGLGLLFRAAKGAVESASAALPTDRLGHQIEHAAKDAAKEVGRAFESIGGEVEKLINPNKGTQPPPQAAAPAAPPPDAPKDDVKYDDGYAPDPKGGPRVG